MRNYGNYGKFLIMGNAGFISSTVVVQPRHTTWPHRLDSLRRYQRLHGLPGVKCSL